MRLKSCAFVLSSIALVLTPPKPVQASDLGAVLFGAIIGGMMQQGQRQPQRSQPRSSGISTAQREQNRQVQTALNYFGWNVGTVDGALGQRSRGAINQYQAAMGYPSTGQLDDNQRAFLLNSHQRAMAAMSIPPYNQVYAQQGPQGLLRTFRNEQLGIPTPGIQQAVAPAPVAPVQPTPQAPAVVPSAPVGIPAFPTVTAVRSLSEHCNSVNVLTTANGGYATATTVTDTGLALNEQFCLGRTFAISETNRLLGAMAGMAPEQVEQQCAGLTQFMEPVVSRAAATSAGDLGQQLTTFLATAGQTNDQLTSAGQICLGTGYRIDDLQMAFASAALLSAAGQPAYGEFVGHHLREGFGTSAAPTIGREWVMQAVGALEAGSPPAILPASSLDRVAVLKVALTDAAAPAPAAPGLPTFPTVARN